MRILLLVLVIVSYGMNSPSYDNCLSQKLKKQVERLNIEVEFDKSCERLSYFEQYEVRQDRTKLFTFIEKTNVLQDWQKRILINELNEKYAKTLYLKFRVNPL